MAGQTCIASLALALAGCAGGPGGNGDRPAPIDLTLDLGRGVQLDLVRVEPGEFLMGSEQPEQGPPHLVRITRPFLMGRTEVTNAQFRRFRSEFDSNDRRGGANLDYQRFIRSLEPELDGGEQPAVHVSWSEAVEFTEWLSARSGLRVRLPSEAEWEYACRAGTTTRYSWGDADAAAHGYANTNDPLTAQVFRLPSPFPADDGFRATAPVGSYRPNAFGLQDMHGNVAEWTADTWHEDYHGAPDDGRAWIDDLDLGRRVTRGGSFECGPGRTHYFSCESAGRSWNHAANRNFGTGFRVVVEVGEPDLGPLEVLLGPEGHPSPPTTR